MTLNQRIFDLMEVKADDHDIDWLKRSLQAAIEIEFFTIPPYLAAWFIRLSIGAGIIQRSEQPFSI